MSTTPSQWMRLRFFGRDTNTTNTTKNLRHRPLGFEGMENRELMSANPLAPTIAPWCDAVVCQSRFDDAPANDFQAGVVQNVAKLSNKGVHASNAERVTREIFNGLSDAINFGKVDLRQQPNLKTGIEIVNGKATIGGMVIKPNQGPQQVKFVVTIGNQDVEVEGTLEIVRTEIDTPLGKGIATTCVFKFKDRNDQSGAVVLTKLQGINNKALGSQHGNVMSKTLDANMAYLRDGVHDKVWKTGSHFRTNVQISKCSSVTLVGGDEGMSSLDGSHHRKDVKFPRRFEDRLTDGSEGAAFQVGAMEAREAAMSQRHDLNRGVFSPLDVPTAPAAPASVPGGLQTPWAVTDQAFAELFAR